MNIYLIDIISTLLIIIGTIVSDYKKKRTFRDYLCYIGLLLFILFNLKILNNNIAFLIISVFYFSAILINKIKGRKLQ